MEPNKWDPRARMRQGYAPSSKSWAPFGYPSPTQYGHVGRGAQRPFEETPSLFSYSSPAQSLSESLFAPFFKAAPQVNPQQQRAPYAFEIQEPDYQDIDFNKEVDWSYLQNVRPFETPFNNEKATEVVPTSENETNYNGQTFVRPELSSSSDQPIDVSEESRAEKAELSKIEGSKNGDNSSKGKLRMCKFYTNGACKYGSKCTFLHEKTQTPVPIPAASEDQDKGDKNTAAKKSVCKFYHAGTCKKGNKCSFLHVLNRQSSSGIKGDDDNRSNASDSSTPPHHSPRSSVDLPVPDVVEPEMPKVIHFAAPAPTPAAPKEKKTKKKKKDPNTSSNATPASKETPQIEVESETAIESIVPLVVEELPHNVATPEEGSAELKPEEDIPFEPSPIISPSSLTTKPTPDAPQRAFGFWYVFAALLAFWKELVLDGMEAGVPTSTKFLKISKKIAYYAAANTLFLLLLCFQQLFRLIKLLGKQFLGNKTGSHYGNSDWDQPEDYETLKSNLPLSKSANEEDEDESSGFDEHEDESATNSGQSLSKRTAAATVAAVASKKKKGKAKRRT